MLLLLPRRIISAIAPEAAYGMEVVENGKMLHYSKDMLMLIMTMPCLMISMLNGNDNA